MQSRKRARLVTSRFHQLTHEIHRLEKSASKGDRKRLEELRAELDSMGGREAYQEASIISTQHCSSSKWVLKVLRRRGHLDGKASSSTVSVLEVGAINTELLDTAGLAVRAIDLNASNPRIEERDFFLMAEDFRAGTRFTHIVCSMVINCVPTALARGCMLVLARALLASEDGMLFLTLPNSCLTPPEDAAARAQGAKRRATKGFTREVFEAILTRDLGFEILAPPDSKLSPKVAFYSLRRGAGAVKQSTVAAALAEVQVQEEDQDGEHRRPHRFSVLVPQAVAGEDPGGGEES